MNLLITDDEWIAVEGLLRGVDWETLGFDNVFASYQAEEAKKILEEQEIQILLCDIEMPGESGIELVRWVKQHHPKTECLFLTCHADFKYAKEAIRMGCGEYLVKPAPYKEIEAAVSKLAEKIRRDEKKQQMADYGKYWIEEKNRGIEAKYGKPMETKDVMETVESYVMSHLNQEISVEKIAREVALHPDYLNRLVKKEKGTSISKYIIEKKMKIAAYMLEETDITLNIIASEIGYQNYPNFVKMFKKTYGISPNEYRKRHKTT